MQVAERMSAAVPIRQLRIECGLLREEVTWADHEIAGCTFKDARLGCRFGKLLKRIGCAIGESIPLVCQDWANTKAAYRFFSNERVSEADILGGHFHSTCDRFAATGGPVLILHDTTEFIYEREQPALIGSTKSVNSGRDKAGRVIAHDLRHPDAFEPRGDDRTAAARVDGSQVLDAQEVQRHQRAQVKDQSHARSDREEGEREMA